MRILASVLGLALLAGASDQQPGTPIEASTCRVRSITDGDTFRCSDGVRVRLLLIDTPERNQVPHGVAAARALQSLLSPGDEVTLESDVQATDRYGRTLAYVYLADDRMVNEEMARLGYAVALVYPPNVRHVERIRKAVATARENKLGLWRVSAFDCLPADRRRKRC